MHPDHEAQRVVEQAHDCFPIETKLTNTDVVHDDVAN